MQLTFENIRIGQKLRTTRTASGMSAEKGEIVTVSDKSTNGNSYIYVEGRNKTSGLGQLVNAFEYFAGVEFDLPLFTAEGTPVEYVSHRGRDPKFPVLAYEGKAKKMSKFTLAGEHSSGEARRNLTNTQVEVAAQPESEDLFMNVYAEQGGFGDFRRAGYASGGLLGSAAFNTVEEADAFYKGARKDNRDAPVRSGIVKVTVVKGKLPTPQY